jgi:aspartate aminotransferase
MAAPVQEVAAYAFAEPEEIRRHVTASRSLHRSVSGALHAEMTAAGARCPAPQAAFYLYPDLEPLRSGAGSRGIELGAELADWLLERHGVAVLTGAAFGDEPEALRFRAATSLLYGSTEEERWRAYRSPDPAGLPWIAGAIAQVGAALRDLAGA